MTQTAVFYLQNQNIAQKCDIAEGQGRLCPDYLLFISTAALRLIQQALPRQLKSGVQAYPRAVLCATSP